MRRASSQVRTGWRLAWFVAVRSSVLLLRSPMPDRRPSPILLKDDPEPTKGQRIREWVRRLIGRSTPDVTGRLQQVLDEDQLQSPRSGEVSEQDFPHRATIQLLPGRLEPLVPEVIQQEVRFQRGNSSGTQEITLGWEIGEPPHHVTLDHPSIQPLHAKMTYQNGQWLIESLVPGDPVEVNGTQVPAAGGPCPLASGDQVRIGEALFQFHMP
jgi:hypothetical protein